MDGSAVDLVFHAVALALDEDGFSMMKQSIEKRRGECAVVVEDFRPVLIDAVRCDDESAVLIPLTDDLEEQIGAMFIDGQVAQFINQE